MQYRIGLCLVELDDMGQKSFSSFSKFQSAFSHGSHPRTLMWDAMHLNAYTMSIAKQPHEEASSHLDISMVQATVSISKGGQRTLEQRPWPLSTGDLAAPQPHELPPCTHSRAAPVWGRLIDRTTNKMAPWDENRDEAIAEQSCTIERRL